MQRADYGVFLALMAKELGKAMSLTAQVFKNWLLDYLNKVFRGV